MIPPNLGGFTLAFLTQQERYKDFLRAAEQDRRLALVRSRQLKAQAWSTLVMRLVHGLLQLF